MTCNRDWIPVESVYDGMLIKQLSQAHRRFCKGMRYQLAAKRPLASVVLSDTQPPVACYIVPPGADGKYEAELEELIQESQLAPWIWRTEWEEMPAFPLRAGTAQASETHAEFAAVS